MSEHGDGPQDEHGIGAAARALMEAATQLTKSLSEDTVGRVTEQTSTRVSGALRDAAAAIDRVPRGQPRRRSSTRRDLLAAAGEVFAERGFHAASLGEVAARAGYTKGAIYAHFSSKDEVMLALMRDATCVDDDEGGDQEWSEKHSIDELTRAYRNGTLAELLDGFADDSASPLPTNLLLSVEVVAYVLRNPEHRQEFAPRFQETMEYLARQLRAAGDGTDREGVPFDRELTPTDMSNAIAFAAIINMSGLYGSLGIPAVTGEGTAEAIGRLLGGSVG